MIGPLNPGEYPYIQVGVVPKTNQPGKWRLIVDLSAPDGQSVNDGIAKSLSSLSYTASVILHLGRGGTLGKNGHSVSLSKRAGAPR